MIYDIKMLKGVNMKINIVKIEKERIRKGITGAKLAELSGITKQAYSDFLKSGSTKLSTLTKIAGALDFDPKDLLI